MNTSDRDRGCASGCAADFRCISQVFDRGELCTGLYIS
nr:MAG TPA: hypothetical protein [Caudoviricetes sp.]DAM14904.1 MAG TPA: hypothetical protein [Caudoviricetes sp.]